MPLIEYVCRGCDRRFEALVTASNQPACPECKGQDLSRQLSVFAVAGRGAELARREPAGPCGTCGDPRGPGSCRLS